MPRVASKSKQPLPTDFNELVRIFPPRSIHDEVEYNNMQKMIDRLTSIPRRTKGQAEYLETLSIIFSDYEREHHPIDTSDLTPLAMLKYLMDQSGMNASDLGRLLGERSLGSKILSGDRELSKAHIRKLAERFSVDVSLLF